jgi:hypothetical protein
MSYLETWRIEEQKNGTAQHESAELHEGCALLDLFRWGIERCIAELVRSPAAVIAVASVDTVQLYYALQRRLSKLA